MRITRRRMAAALVSGAALAQAPPASPPATPEAELKAIERENRDMAQALDKVKVPLAGEPAFAFKA